MQLAQHADAGVRVEVAVLLFSEAQIRDGPQVEELLRLRRPAAECHAGRALKTRQDIDRLLRLAGQQELAREREDVAHVRPTCLLDAGLQRGGALAIEKLVAAGLVRSLRVEIRERVRHAPGAAGCRGTRVGRSGARQRSREDRECRARDVPLRLHE